MVFFNYALRKLNAKIVYYGPGLCGKTTNLQWIHDHFEGGQKGKMISLATEGDRTIFFDLLPLEIGTIRGMEVTLQLYTVPGQVHYNSTRQLVLRGADGVVFVADSQRTMQKSNEDSFRNLRENLVLQGIDLKTFPHVLQFNKRDLRDLLSIEEMDGQLNLYDAPIFEATATDGVGVQETLEGIVKLVMRSLRDRYESVTTQDPRPAGGPSVTAGAWPVAATAPPRSSGGPVQPPRPAGFGPPTAPRPPQSSDATTAELGPPPGSADTEDLRFESPSGGPSGDSVEVEPPPPIPDSEFVSPDDEQTAVMEGVPPIDRDDDAERFDLTVDRDDDAGPAETAGDVGERRLEPPDGGQEWSPSASPFADQPTDVATDDLVDENATAWPPPPGPSSAPMDHDDGDVPFEDAETEKGIDLDGGSWSQQPERLRQDDRFVDSIHAPGPFAPTESDDDDDDGDSPFEMGTPPRVAETPPVEDAPEPPTEPEPEPPAEPGPAFDAEPPAEAAAVPEPEPEPPPPPPAEEPPGPAPSPPRAGRPAVDDLVDSVLGRHPGRPPTPQPPRPPSIDRPDATADRRPVTIGDGDPFADDEEVAPVQATAEVLPPSDHRRSGLVNVEAHDNQLQLRLHGTGAIAESGQVRELDIQVPVPGAWVGHKRVTLQLRLTLTPTPEDEDVENGGDS